MHSPASVGLTRWRGSLHSRPMKRLLLPSLMVALVCAGCKTTTSGNVAPAITQLAVQAFASYELAQYPGDVPYVQAVTPFICNFAGSGTIDPQQIVADLDKATAGLAKTPTGTLIVNGALALYEQVYNSYGTNAQTSVVGPYLLAVCNGLEAALPNPTPQAVAAMTPAAKRAALYPPKWAWVK